MSESSKSGSPKEPLPKVVSIDELRARRSQRTPEKADSRDLDRVIEDLKRELEQLPDVREEKVIQAKLRMSTGFYGDDQVKLRVIESMLEALGTDLRAQKKASETRGSESSAPDQSSDPSDPSVPPESS